MEVENIEATLEQAISLGAQKSRDVSEFFGSKNAEFIDPYHYSWSLNQTITEIPFEKRYQTFLAFIAKTPRKEMINMKYAVFLRGINLELYLEYNEVYNWLNNQNEQIQFIFLDSVQKVGTSFEDMTTLLRENVSLALFGGGLDGQQIISDLPYEDRKKKFAYNVIHAINEDEYYNIVLPEDGFGTE
ncbi:hypothetical protein [Lactococcus termiticola]|uniref:Uncharacterized protein n=1 Tax=Lactococcus termiticola TaxID=2169526 RepID=A0A2R5HGE3_9LACT|nr:hypothetical protein [Lactococcus termiticola]GBG97084.1 hypothetical protein NtB2_01221 [Lactococcus termiticola]